MSENKAARIAELERQLDWLSDKRFERFRAISYELARLRNEITSAVLAQSEAEPWRCPCGIPPESHHICSAGTCWWCLADRVQAQSDAGPQDVRAILLEMRDITFSVSGKDAQQVEDYFTRRASDALAALAQSDAESDASAELIEAAELAEEYAGRTAGGAQYALETLAEILRSRAAGRSGE